MKRYQTVINLYSKKADVADFKHFLAFGNTMPVLFYPSV